MPHNLLIRNARIWTGDPARPWAEAAFARNGRFASVGGEHEISAATGTAELDTRGRLVLPGFTDSHVHLLATGQAMRSVDLKDAPSEAEAARRVGVRALETPAGQWIRGAGWDQHRWPGARFPHRATLDAIAPNHPVVLTHTSGHCLWANSAALRAAGVTAATAATPGGAIDIDAAGEPTGVLRDAAMRLLNDAVPPIADAERRQLLKAAIAHAHSLGVTGVHAMDIGAREHDALTSLHADGALALRVRAFLSASRLDTWIERKLRTGGGDDVLRIGGVKFFADGALGSMTAWMDAPYEGSHDTGLALQPPAELEDRVRRALTHGLAPAIHAIGDRANHEVLDLLERARDLEPGLPRRIEHAQLLRADDIARFGTLAVTASVQPIHATQDMAKVDRAWGARGRLAYAFASLLASGANLAFGSDSPVETIDPLAGIHAAVTRRGADGGPPGGWYPQERLPLEAVLHAYTSGPARAVGEESASGRIAAGYHADFVVLSRDVFALDDEMRILDARVDVTAVAGAVVYNRDDA